MPLISETLMTGPDGKKRFEQFRVASNLSRDPEDRQISTLLYCLGEEAENVLTSTGISEDDRKKYDSVLLQFDKFFKVRRNVIFERAVLNRRNQQQGESVEQYIVELYKLAETCEYGTMTPELIRDRLIVGILDSELSERLQLIPDLSLENAKEMVRQSEAVHEQQQELKGSKEFSSVNELASRRGKYPATGRKYNFRTLKACSRCGRGPHPREKCPAIDAECHNCKKRGHFSSQCFSKRISEVEVTEECNLEAALLNTVESNPKTFWVDKISINRQETVFKLDTGAEVTAISQQTFESLDKPRLSKAEKILYGPSKQLLDVTGQFMAKLSKGKITTTQQVFVINGLKNNLLGLPAITQLNLVARVGETTDIRSQIVQKYSPMFQGLGNLGCEYTIKLKPGASPHSIFAPRHVPLPLRSKVKEELEKMESMGVISRVDEPTEWCAGMVVVPKKGDKIRVCVDLKPLNSNVLREVHPLPKVDFTFTTYKALLVSSNLQLNQLKICDGIFL